MKNAKNTYGRVLILVKLQTEACNFTKINTLPWVFFVFWKLKEATIFCSVTNFGYVQNRMFTECFKSLFGNSLINEHCESCFSVCLFLFFFPFFCLFIYLESFPIFLLNMYKLNPFEEFIVQDSQENIRAGIHFW